jgi:GNAT superfamily N-acetyltransferase
MITIREAKIEDAETILKFVIELARYEKAEHEVTATVDDIKNSFFGLKVSTYALICECNHQPIGFAVYFFNYSTWQGKSGLYLEDLYVTPTARGLGAGKALFRELANIAKNNKCGRFEWSVLDWNKPAIEFYEALGATAKSEWLGYRLVEQQFDSLITTASLESY